ncbi:MAG: cupin domain-containing protein [Phycisphaerales bacterium]
MATEATVTSWIDLPEDHPMARISRRRIMGEKMMVSQVHLSQGFDLPSHQHENEQFVVVLVGRCLFGLGAPGTAEHRTVEVKTGQVLVLPPNVPHSCLALEETDILDLFSPVSATTGVDRRGAHG